MTPSTPLAADFPPLRRADWEDLVRATQEAGTAAAGGPERLGSRTADGIELRPLYLREDGLPAAAFSFPGSAPFVRGARAAGAVRHGWDVRPVRAEATPEACNRAVLEDLEGGATSIELELDLEGAAARRGLRLERLSDLERALEGVRVDAIALALDAGPAFSAAAAAMVALLRRRGLDPLAARLAFGADPLGALARTGTLPQGSERALDELAVLASHTAHALPASTALRADGSPYHDAGASDVEELSCVLATATAYLRAMVAGGLGIEQAFGQLQLAVSLDADVFGGIAKLRAARLLWARVAHECGLSEHAPQAAPRLQARAARRMLASRDPLLNLLRVTAAAFAAAAGGAETISTPAFDEPNGTPGDLARRLARNTQLILAEEAHLHRVIDPAGGSWYVEHLTEALCERAWERFRDLERRGGMLAVLVDGSLQRDVAETAAVRALAVATRRETLLGVNRFLAPGESTPHRTTGPARRAAVLARGGGQSFPDLVASWLSGEAFAWPQETSPTKVEALPPRRAARPFEALREACDRRLATTGARPRVFLARLAASRDRVTPYHDARADWLRDLLAVGGFEAVDRGGFADAGALAVGFHESSSRVAVLCGSDESYAEAGEPVTRALEAAGAELILLAGNLRGAPELERRLRDAGVAELLHEGSDVLQALRRIGRALALAPALLRDEDGGRAPSSASIATSNLEPRT